MQRSQTAGRVLGQPLQVREFRSVVVDQLCQPFNDVLDSAV